MKFLAVSALVLVLAGCGGDQPTEPQTSTVTVHVANQAGLPLGGVAVRAQHMLSPQEVADITSATTDTTGTAVLVLPENVTAQIGLGVEEEPPTWQPPFIVTTSDFGLSYTFWADINCGVVDPTSPSSCPSAMPPAPEPSP